MSNRADGSNGRGRRVGIWSRVALAVLVWIVYANSIEVPFQFDDRHVIPENPSVRGPADIPSFFTDISTFSVLPGTRDYRPMFLTFMALAWWVGGGSTVPFHLVSVFLHVGCVLLAFGIYRATFPDRGPPDSPRNLAWAAWIGAALFAIHPMATETVVYISGQAEVLSAFFYLVSFRAFLAVYARPGASSARRRGVLRGGSYLAYAVGLLSKPIAISLPINLLSWELLLAEPQGSASLRERLRKHVPYLAISLGFIALRAAMVTGPFGGGPARPVIEHYLTQTKVLVWYYLGRSIVPVSLNVDPGYPISVSPFDGAFLLSLAVIVGLIWLLYRFRRHRAVVFWSAWFPICLLLTTYGVILRQLVSEHRVYVSLVGFCAVAALLLDGLRSAMVRRRVFRHDASARAALTVAVVAVMLFYGGRTIARNAVWASDLTLWEDSVAHSGTWRSHLNYGLALENAGRPAEALAQFQKAVEIAPYAINHTNLGLAYVKRGEIDNGLTHLETAVRLFPSSADAHRYLAYGLMVAGRLDEAEAEYRRAIDLQADYVGAYAGLADLYERTGRWTLAAEAYRRILEIDPAEHWVEASLRAAEAAGGETPPSRDATSELQEGRYRDAVAILERTSRERPSDPDVLFALGYAYQMLGERANASRVYEELLQTAPEHRQGTFNLAYLYLEGTDREDWRRAVALFERVLEIDPQYVEALFHLATAHRRLGNAERSAEYDRRYLEVGTHEALLAQSRERLGLSAFVP